MFNSVNHHKNHLWRNRKKLALACAMACGGYNGVMPNALADAILYTADSSNAVTGTVGLTTQSLGNAPLGNPSSLQSGSNQFNYVVLLFRPAETGSYIFGQTSAPVDTVMIFYQGRFDSASPGTGALVGNDDTSPADHQAVPGLGGTTIQCGGPDQCPQVTYNVTANQVYTILISTYNAGNALGIPQSFYSSGAGEFGSFDNLTPIDQAAAYYEAYNLDFTVKPDFEGGVLLVNLANQTYTTNFLLSDKATNTLDLNNNNVTFSGDFADAVIGQPGVLTIINSAGNSGSVTLSGDNTFTGGITLDPGTKLLFSADDNLGATEAQLTLNGGTLENTAALTSARKITLSSDSAIQSDADLTLNGVITGNGGLTKTGAGTLTLADANDYQGGTTISAGTLIAANGQALGAGAVINSADLRLDFADNQTLANSLSGTGSLEKTGTGSATLTAGGSAAGDVSVAGGTLALAFTQPGVFSAQNYTTQENAVTSLAENARLVVAGTFTQSENSIFQVSIGAVNLAEITAQQASLDGTLQLLGFDEVAGTPVKSSEAASQLYTLIRTTNGISGDFVNEPLTPTGTDYLLYDSALSQNGLDYTLGFKLAWNDGNATTSTGDFTISQDEPFNVDTVLADRTGAFANWDGKTLIKNGPGLLILSADNTYTGGTIVNAGTLSIAADANLGAASSSLTLNGGTLETTADITSGRPVAVDGAATISVDANTQLAASGAFSGNSALTKAGAGVLTLTGDSSAYTGNVTLAAGMLNANGVLDSAVAVQAGATLGGSGSIGALTVGTDGTVAPGNSIGTLTVNGDATFAAGSVYQAQINAAGQSDLLKVNGKTLLNGGTVNVTSAPGNYSAIDRYTLLTASGGVTGQFADLTTDLAFLNPALEYDPDDVYLQFTRNDVNFGDFAGNSNQSAVARAAQSLGAGNRLYDALAALPNDTGTVRHALNQLSGELHASLKAALIEDSHFMRDGANDRLRSSFNDDGGAGGPTVMTYDQHGVARYAKPTTDEAAFWGRIYGARGSQDGNSNAASMSRDSHGAILGGDAPAGDWRLGALVGIGRSTFDIDSRNSSGDSNNYSVGVYAGTQAVIEQHTLAFRSGLIYTRNNIDTTRNVSFPGFSDRLSGDYSANSWQGFGEVAYPFKLEQTAIEPFDNLAIINLRTDGFSEHGAEAALQADGDTSNTTFNTLGIRASQQFKAGSARLTANGMLGWRHAFGANTPTINQRFIGSTDFTIAGTPIAENAAVVNVGLDMAIKEQGTLGLAYQGQLGNQSHENGVQATFAWKF